MKDQNKISSQNNKSNFVTLVAGLWNQVDYAFPEVTSSSEWKSMTSVERDNARRELFRLLHGNSPEVLAIKMTRIIKKLEGSK